MLLVEKCAVPAATLLETYVSEGCYTDCYRSVISQRVSFPTFIFTFYTTPLFKLERFILKWTVSKPSTDLQAKALAYGHADNFAAWEVEKRNANELLMCDYSSRTRSWLMLIPGSSSTDLFFGSAVVPVRNSRTGDFSVGSGVQTLLGFHRIYSILLLYSASIRMKRQHAKER